MSPLVRGAVFAAAAATLALAMRPLAGRHAAVHRASTRLPGPPPAAPAPVRGTPGVANCTLRLFEQVIDHFSFAATPTGAETFTQRVFLYDDVWRKDETGVVFFYSGNESPVELYIQHTGLMWEHAAEFGARLVFAEHR